MNAKLLPHWAQLVMALAVVIITWVVAQNANGEMVLPAVAISILTTIKTLLGLFTDSVQTTRANIAADKAVDKVLS